MSNQENFEKAWAKIILNPSYGNKLPAPPFFYLYDENLSLKITEEGRKNLELIQNIIPWK